MALVAEWKDPGTATREILGIGRLTRLPGTNEAEFAVIVNDQFQRRGSHRVLVVLANNIRWHSHHKRHQFLHDYYKWYLLSESEVTMRIYLEHKLGLSERDNCTSTIRPGSNRGNYMSLCNGHTYSHTETL